MKGRIAVLWHLHQPDYRDPAGRPILPWVRLHALRGYRDLCLETVESGVRWTINVVPVLLDQLEAYAAGVEDDHLAATAAPADAVEPALIRRLPSGHPAMTRAHPVYAALRRRVEGGDSLSVGELRDVQVWATLAWFGATAVRDHPSLRALIAKGSGFDEADKVELLRVQREILREIPAAIRALAASPASVSVCAYYHPILPLLVDFRAARRAMPEIPDEALFAHPEDALRQLVDGRRRGERALGRPPIGLWPSEGSVSPEIVPLVAQAGFRWLATDAGILARSERTADVHRPGAWDLGHGVVGFFRDTDLSDRIGFQYATRPPDEAAAEWFAVARRRADDGTLLVALDGENPWESYPDAGAALRQRLLHGLRDDGVGLDEASRERPVGNVSRLHSGSWIGADFRIWAGHEEDRAAWRWLGRTRAAVAEASPELREAAMLHVLAAEGSDWFWWYGDDFEVVESDPFDHLFRSHLQAAWAVIGRPAPPELARSLRSPRLAGSTAPTRLLAVDPAVAGAWAGWVGAGELGAAEGAMARGHGWTRIRYGWSDDGALWIRVDLRGDSDAWRLEPAPGAIYRWRGGLAAVYREGHAAFTLVAPDGERWPEQPLTLLRAPDAPLRWWMT